MGMLEGISYIFQVPFKWFKDVDARVFGDHAGHGIKFEDSMDGSRAISVDDDVLKQTIEVPSSEAGTPSSAGTMPTDEVTQRASTLWTAGGANGAVVQMFYRGTGGDTHYLYAARLTISKDGLITKIEAVQNGGMEIQA